MSQNITRGDLRHQEDLTGTAGNDTLRVTNNSTASVDGGDGNDTISADSGTTSTIFAGNGDDSVL
ncbi:hypothetical protein ACQUJO_23540, partial [Ralstonia pseudosolanacearum]